MHTLGSFAAKQQVSSHFFGMGVGATKIRLLNVRPGASLQHTLSKPHFEFAAEQDEFTLTNVCAFLHAVHGPLQALAREHEQVEQVPEHSAHTDKHDDAAVQDHLHILHRHVWKTRSSAETLWVRRPSPWLKFGEHGPLWTMENITPMVRMENMTPLVRMLVACSFLNPCNCTMCLLGDVKWIKEKAEGMLWSFQEPVSNEYCVTLFGCSIEVHASHIIVPKLAADRIIVTWNYRTQVPFTLAQTVTERLRKNVWWEGRANFATFVGQTSSRHLSCNWQKATDLHSEWDLCVDVLHMAHLGDLQEFIVCVPLHAAMLILRTKRQDSGVGVVCLTCEEFVSDQS